MDAVEELSERCGKSCWIWKVKKKTRQEKKIKER